MIKLIARILPLLLWLPLAASAQYTQGVDYQVVANPQSVDTGKKIEVREFFWYGCPHCFALEPYVEKWLKNEPKNVAFVRTPAALNERWAVHARAFYAFKALGLSDKLHKPFFDAIQIDNRQLFDPESIADFVAQHGGDRTAFLNAYRSFGVETAVAKDNQLARAYNIDSVPTVVVDGKYLTNSTMAKGPEHVMQVVNFLVQKAAADRAARKH
jgi:thiol:disulfide interchange protein DsbA